MNRSRVPHAIMKYQPTENRNPHPLKRLLESYIKTGMGPDTQDPDSMMTTNCAKKF